MKYKMYDEMMEQPESLERTFESEWSTMDEISEWFWMWIKYI